jgi:hypothetical protein
MDDLSTDLAHQGRDAGEGGTEEQVWVAYPTWLLGGPDPRSPEQWLTDWEDDRARPETMRVARAFVVEGFTECGAQIRPKSATYLAQAAGVSPSSAERFLAKGRKLGKLTPTGRKVGLVEGKRFTPLYHLTRDTGLRMLDVIPDAVRVEAEAVAEKFPAEAPWPGSTWEHVEAAPPAWAAPLTRAA